jgi:predicted nucleic acid-binding protein
MRRRLGFVNARRWSLETLLTPATRLAIDSNVIIYLLDGAGPQAETAAAIVDAIAEGTVEGTFASLGLTEVLAGPARTGDAARFKRTADELRDLGLRIRPLDVETAVEAAWLRGSSDLGIADAVHIATARAAGATVFLTNDRRIRPDGALGVVYLDDLMPGA